MTQFHPTVYIDNNESRKMLLTEALRGEGAYIIEEYKEVSPDGEVELVWAVELSEFFDGE